MAKLFKSAEKGDLTSLEGCIESGTHSVNDQDAAMFNYTPLHYAAWRGHVNIVKYLLDAKAEINPIGENGWSPLHLAVHNQQIQVIDQLLEHAADPNLVEERGDTILHQAIYSGDPAIVERIILAKANINQMNMDGDCPLHIASKWGKASLVELLLRNKADISATNADGQNAMDLTNAGRYAEFAKWGMEEQSVDEGLAGECEDYDNEDAANPANDCKQS